jgi:ribosomal protein S18 acetylase RimI-like enzyme
MEEKKPCMANIEIVEKKDLKIIHDLAHVIWPLVYDYMISKDQIDYMLDKMYSVSSLEKQMEEGDVFILLVEDEIPHGFASYRIHHNDHRVRLHKLYVHPAAQKNGWGLKMLSHIFEDGRKQRKKEIELNVNRNNKSIGFYQHIGFVIEKSEDIEIGHGYQMNDYVMVKDLSL